MKQRKTRQNDDFTHPDGRIKASVVREAFTIPLQAMTREEFLAELLEFNPQLDPEKDLGIKPTPGQQSQPKAS